MRRTYGAPQLRYRTQYHFRPGRSGVDAWDVHRLIALTADFPVKEIDLCEIWEVDSVYWFNDGDEVPTVRNVVNHIRLVNEVDLSHPIILGTGPSWMVRTETYPAYGDSRRP